MRSGKVCVISISGLRNRIHQSGEIVNENQFPAGRFDELLKEGFLEFYQEDNQVANPPDAKEIEIIRKPIDETPKGIKEKEEKTAQQIDKNIASDAVIQTKAEQSEDTTRKDIIADLEKAGVKYGKNMSKAELYELWRASKKK
jgi:hypothetical protein